MSPAPDSTLMKVENCAKRGLAKRWCYSNQNMSGRDICDYFGQSGTNNCGPDSECQETDACSKRKVEKRDIKSEWLEQMARTQQGKVKVCLYIMEAH